MGSGNMRGGSRVGGFERGLEIGIRGDYTQGVFGWGYIWAA